MARIFISHSSHNDDTALRLQDWLKDNGWSDTFLDLDPKEGLAPGEKWQEELRREADRCEAVLCLISQDWLNSPWCLTEFLLAKQLGKRIFPVIVGSVTPAALPKEMTAQSQAVDLVNDANGYARLRASRSLRADRRIPVSSRCERRTQLFSLAERPRSSGRWIGYVRSGILESSVSLSSLAPQVRGNPRSCAPGSGRGYTATI
jgi:TIR domain